MAKIDSNFQTAQSVCTGFNNIIVPKKFKDPRTGKESGEPKYDTELLFDVDSEDLKTLKAMAVAVAKEKFPGIDVVAEYKAGQFRMPWTLGDTIIENKKKKLAALGKSYDGGADYKKGKSVVTAKTSAQFPPSIAALVGNAIIAIDTPALKELHKGKFFNGTEAYAVIRLNAYEPTKDDDNPGVNCFLQQFVSLNRGKQIGGRSAAQTFAGYVGKVTSENPIDDDITF